MVRHVEIDRQWGLCVEVVSDLDLAVDADVDVDPICRVRGRGESRGGDELPVGVAELVGDADRRLLGHTFNCHPTLFSYDVPAIVSLPFWVGAVPPGVRSPMFVAIGVRATVSWIALGERRARGRALRENRAVGDRRVELVLDGQRHAERRKRCPGPLIPWPTKSGNVRRRGGDGQRHRSADRDSRGRSLIEHGAGATSTCTCACNSMKCFCTPACSRSATAWWALNITTEGMTIGPVFAGVVGVAPGATSRRIRA